MAGQSGGVDRGGATMGSSTSQKARRADSALVEVADKAALPFRVDIAAGTYAAYQRTE